MEMGPVPKDLKSVPHTYDVKKADDGVLVASTLTAMICECCGLLWIGGLDMRKREFVRLPISAEVARAVAAELVELAGESERIAVTGVRHKH